jgi:hypothetical protein
VIDGELLLSPWGSELLCLISSQIQYSPGHPRCVRIPDWQQYTCIASCQGCDMGRGHLEAGIKFPVGSAPMPFPSDDVTLPFAVMHYNLEHNNTTQVTKVSPRVPLGASETCLQSSKLSLFNLWCVTRCCHGVIIQRPWSPLYPTPEKVMSPASCS